jgi:pimeloyl-ACP methyl ester carboxylesterase
VRQPRREFLRLVAGGAAAAAAAPLAAMAQTSTPAAKEPPAPALAGAASLKRSMVRANGVDLFVRDTGAGLPPLLCLHGMQGRGETFTGLIARYRDRYRVIAPDQRGHGMSGRPAARYAAEDFAEDAHQLLLQLRSTPAVVIAHSLSGRVAPVLAARHPESVKGVVLLDPAPGDGPERPADTAPDKIPDQDPMTADWPLPYPSREEAMRDLGQRFPGPAYPLFFAESLVESVAGYDFMWSGRAMAAIHEYRQDTDRFLPEIRCPVLLVRATQTRVCTPEHAAKIRSLVKECAFVEIEGGHMAYLEKPEETFKALDDWLKRV